MSNRLFPVGKYSMRLPDFISWRNSAFQDPLPFQCLRKCTMFLKGVGMSKVLRGALIATSTLAVGLRSWARETMVRRIDDLNQPREFQRGRSARRVVAKSGSALTHHLACGCLPVARLVIQKTRGRCRPGEHRKTPRGNSLPDTSFSTSGSSNANFFAALFHARISAQSSRRFRVGLWVGAALDVAWIIHGLASTVF